MIYLSIYYFIGGVIALPTITFFTTKWWLDKKILAIEGETIMSPNSIEDAQVLSPSQFTFSDKKDVIHKRLQFNDI